MEGSQLKTRPLRVDAERNLRRLLDAARAAFAEQGLGASVDEIAKRAGIGKGTVFRRFPTKEHLISAVLLDRLEEALRLGSDLSAKAAPNDALREFMRSAARMQANDHGFFEGVAKDAYGDPAVAAAKERLLTLTGELLHRAQQAGTTRKDVNAVDILMLVHASVQAAAPFRDSAPELWQRFLEISLDGLNAPSAHALSQPAPSFAAESASSAKNC